MIWLRSFSYKECYREGNMQAEKPMMRLLIARLLLVTGTFLVLECAQAAEKIRLFYSAITGEQSIIYIVKESGMLQKYGLDPEMIFIDSGTVAVQTMLSGESQLGIVASTPVVLSALHGSGLKMVAGLINSLTYILVTSPNITRPEQLKGGKIAIA